MTTLHTYPDLLIDGGRLAATSWNLCPHTAAEAVAATLKYNPEVIILAVTDADGYRVARGHAPGGLAA